MDITWRTTRIRMPPNNMIIIPNNKLAQSIVTNYDLPEKSIALQTRISVGYNSDPDRVEQVLIEEAAQTTTRGRELQNQGSSRRLLSAIQPYY